MSRLYDICYNKEQWNIRGSRDTGYSIVHKKTFYSCPIYGDIIGIEQVSDDEFLVYRRVMRDEWQIVRLKLDVSNFKVDELYRKNFRNFRFLTKDIIIFDRDARSLGATLYSISNNEEYDTLNHILSSEPDCRLIKDRKIELLYENPDSDEYPTALYIEYNFSQYSLDICAYLQVLLDVNTFKPIRPVYSTLRDKYFYINDTVTLGQIAKEDSHYAEIIVDFLRDFYSNDNRKDLKELNNTV